MSLLYGPLNNIWNAYTMWYLGYGTPGALIHCRISNKHTLYHNLMVVYHGQHSFIFG